MIIPVILITIGHHAGPLMFFFLMMRTFKKHSYSDLLLFFRIYSRVLSTVVTMLYVTSQDYFYN